MRPKELKPQISQMNADFILYALICANLRHLRLNHPDEASREILEKIECQVHAWYALPLIDPVPPPEFGMVQVPPTYRVKCTTELYALEYTVLDQLGGVLNNIYDDWAVDESITPEGGSAGEMSKITTLASGKFE